MDGGRDRVPTRAKGERVIFWKCALPLQACRHWRFQELGQGTQYIPSLGIVDTLAGVNNRPIRLNQLGGDGIDCPWVRSRANVGYWPIVDWFGDVFPENVTGNLDKHRSRPALLDLGKCPPQRIRYGARQGHLFCPLRYISVIQKRIEIRRNVCKMARIARRQNDDGNGVAVGLSDTSKGVLGTRPVLHRKHANPLARGRATDRVGHVEAGSFLTNDNRPDVGFGGGFDDRIDRIANEKAYPFALEDFCDRGCDFHRVSPPGFRNPVLAPRCRHTIRNLPR